MSTHSSVPFPPGPAADKASVASLLAEDPETLTGVQKAATFLIAMGVERAGQILQHLDKKEVEKISIEIARIQNVSSEVMDAVLEEYHEMSLAQQYLTQGGAAFAREALIEALGESRAEDIMMKIEAATDVSAFHQLQTVEIDQLTSFIRAEHPQTAALIFSHIHPRKAAEVLRGLDEHLQANIMYRLASMNKTSPEMVAEVEHVIQEKLEAVFGQQLSRSGGPEIAADILNGVSHSQQQCVMEEIRRRDRELAEEISTLMFTFDDLVHLSARDLQTVLQDVDQQDVALALKATPDTLKKKILHNLSSRVADMVTEELDLMGRVRVSDVDEAQQKIMKIARELEVEGTIALASDDENYIE